MHSNFSSPHSAYGSNTLSTSTTVVSTFSATSSVSPSPIASPLVSLRNAKAATTSPVRFPSPFKSFKSAPSPSPQVMNETISNIMQDEGGASQSQSFPKSPGSPSARPLYSPKPSPGVRPNVQSPAPSASAPAAVSYNQLPAIDRVHRYVVTGTLQQSLFGVVKLAFDRVLKQQVAIKISRRERAQQQQTRSGVSVLENVRREAAVMQYLHERSAAGNLNRAPVEKRKSLYAEMFANMTVNELLNNKGGPGTASANGGGGGGKKAKRMSSRATQHMRGDERMVDDDSGFSTPTSAANLAAAETDTEDSEMRPYTPSSRMGISISTPSSQSSQSSTYSGLSSPVSHQLPTGPMDATDLEGERYICRYVEEMEDESFHYLVTDFIPAGDLYSMLTSFPQHRLSEVQARGLFRQMVLGVKYLHLRNVAHLDMSLENMCLDMEDAVRIIDFGVAALHPFTPTSFQTQLLLLPLRLFSHLLPALLQLSAFPTACRQSFVVQRAVCAQPSPLVSVQAREGAVRQAGQDPLHVARAVPGSGVGRLRQRRLLAGRHPVLSADGPPALPAGGEQRCVVPCHLQRTMAVAADPQAGLRSRIHTPVGPGAEPHQLHPQAAGDQTDM